jgi:hypothetical protein
MHCMCGSMCWPGTATCCGGVKDRIFRGRPQLVAMPCPLVGYITCDPLQGLPELGEGAIAL